MSFRSLFVPLSRDCRHHNVHLVYGRELLLDADGYTMDLAHHGDFGMMQIGERLARRLERLL